MLFGQGMTDTLFNAEQGLANWHQAITKRARKKSIFVGYNGGHALPAALPQGVNVTSDPCSKQLAGGDFQALHAAVLRRAAPAHADRTHRLPPHPPRDTGQHAA